MFAAGVDYLVGIASIAIIRPDLTILHVLPPLLECVERSRASPKMKNTSSRIPVRETVYATRKTKTSVSLIPIDRTWRPHALHAVFPAAVGQQRLNTPTAVSFFHGVHNNTLYRAPTTE